MKTLLTIHVKWTYVYLLGDKYLYKVQLCFDESTGKSLWEGLFTGWSISTDAKSAHLPLDRGSSWDLSFARREKEREFLLLILKTLTYISSPGKCTHAFIMRHCNGSWRLKNRTVEENRSSGHLWASSLVMSPLFSISKSSNAISFTHKQDSRSKYT